MLKEIPRDHDRDRDAGRELEEGWDWFPRFISLHGMLLKHDKLSVTVTVTRDRDRDRRTVTGLSWRVTRRQEMSSLLRSKGDDQ